MSVRILVGDVRDKLKELDDESVQCVVTSPPYWGLRDYGTATWDGGDTECDHRAKGERRQLPHGDGRDNDCYVDERKPIPGAGALYRETCGKCGARRVDAQLGLEPTPEEHVAAMVEVFRDVRRVMRADATLWLNYGDSYAGSQQTGGSSIRCEGDKRGALKRRVATQTAQKDAQTPCVSGLKPKDLVGMPWRVARALQEPYYTGKIRNAVDRVWLAAAIDGEGCIFIHKRKAGQNNGQGYERKNASFGAGLEISNTSKPFVERCLEITGVGSICHQDSGRRQRLWRWNLRSNQCRDILREVYPDLVAKQGEARLAIGCPSSGPEAESAHESLMAIHNGGEPTMDFPEPPSMFEPGFYLRSDIIWSKKNPMPESVTDRPTKSHEHIFLMTKSARYFYDADAVREDAVCDGDMRHLRSDTSKQSGGCREDGGSRKRTGNPTAGRNLRDVWTIATHAYSAAHFATFPPKLVEPCIKAGTSEAGCCSICGAPLCRVIESTGASNEENEIVDHGGVPGLSPGSSHDRVRSLSGSTYKHVRRGTETFIRTCEHADEPTAPCTVLDPFGGAGTVGLVADQLGRDAILIELNPEYAAMAKRRIYDDLPMFANVETEGNPDD